MRKTFHLLLLALVLGSLGCGSVKRMVPDTDFWRDEVPTTVARTPTPQPALPALRAPAAIPAPFALADLDGPSAADRAAQAALGAIKAGDPDQGALRAAWRYLRDHHVPAQVLTIALHELDRRAADPGLAMPADPGQLDLSTGGLGAVLLAALVLLFKRLTHRHPPSPENIRRPS